jgi:hypothetical protein
MSFRTVPMFAGEETPDGFALPGSEIASLLDGTPPQMGFGSSGRGQHVGSHPLMPDKRRYSNAQ